jgi:diguanylate cyclase (GGDEF)-like protein
MARRRWYAALAVLIATGAPVGLAVTRALARGGLGLAALASDLRSEVLTYAYVTVSTMAIFGGFGYVLGVQMDRLVSLSNQDPLTGLQNWRVLQDRIRDELARVRRYRQPLSLLLLDLDGLKRINDVHGHAAGTAALLRLGDALRRGAREVDTAARWGGDEFALLAPSTSLEAAVELGERLRAQAEASADESGQVRFTVSVGVASVEPPVDDIARVAQQLWADADAALYEAKGHGRNRVHAFPAGSTPAGFSATRGALR